VGAQLGADLSNVTVCAGREHARRRTIRGPARSAPSPAARHAASGPHLP
jgi:hypothetical protein